MIQRNPVDAAGRFFAIVRTIKLAYQYQPVFLPWKTPAIRGVFIGYTRLEL
jgi:hypothetical protein